MEIGSKDELFRKYNISEEHEKWDTVDSLFLVEVHKSLFGTMPEDEKISWVCEFIDKSKKDFKWFFSLEHRGSLFLTAKRAVYRFADDILEELKFEASDEERD